MQDSKEVHPLRLERLNRSWTQKELADFAQVSLSSVERAEHGRPLRVDICRRLCDCLGKKKPEELGLYCYGIREESRNGIDVSEEKEAVLGVNVIDLDALRRRLFEYVLATVGMAPAISIQDVLDPEPWERLSYLQDIDEETLLKFEKITANCWQLLKFDGLAAVDQLLPTYLPQIAAFARQPSKYQERVASLVSQGYMLAGLVAVLNLRPKDSETHCKRAVSYAQMAKNRNLEVAAIKHLATKFLDNNHPMKTLQTYQEALPLVGEVSPLLRGRTYLGLALAYARNKQKENAFCHLTLAHDTFPEHPEVDPSFAYADCGISSLYHYAGLIHMEFDHFEKARDTFAQVEDLSSKVVVPERTRIEIINCQAEASLALRDIQSTCNLVEAGIIGAKKLQSEKRYNDTLTIYRQMRLIWPDEQQVKVLAELFSR